MGTKRPHDSTERASKKPRTGFKVGPDHLPQGPRRRHAQKIKNTLIQKAQTRRHYEKVKRQELGDPEHPTDLARPNNGLDSSEAPLNGEEAPFNDEEMSKEPGAAPRESTMSIADTLPLQQDTDGPSAAQQSKDPQSSDPYIHPARRRKLAPFHREEHYAARKKQEQAVSRDARVKAQQERERKRAMYERERRMMAKAKRLGADGRPKLGREAVVLLSRVKRLVGEDEEKTK